MQFAFLAMDGGQAKRDVVEALEQYKIPFIDVGMGLHVKNGSVGGIVRVTASSEEQRKHVHERGRINFSGGGVENDYKSNIQVADLNALNAVLAIIKWKKMFGFYFDFEKEFFTTYTIDSNLLTGDDTL